MFLTSINILSKAEPHFTEMYTNNIQKWMIIKLQKHLNSQLNGFFDAPLLEWLRNEEWWVRNDENVNSALKLADKQQRRQSV